MRTYLEIFKFRSRRATALVGLATSTKTCFPVFQEAALRRSQTIKEHVKRASNERKAKKNARRRDATSLRAYIHRIVYARGHKHISPV